MSNIPTQTPNKNTQQSAPRPMQQGQRPMQQGQRPVQQGQRPIQQGQRPVQQGQRPVQQGQRPVQQGQRPMQQGQRPMQQGQRPMQQGQRPMQQGQRPMQQGQRPMQQGQRPMQQGQRPMQQGQRPRPQGTPQRPQHNDSSIKSLLTIAIIVTSVLLVIAIIAGAVVMSVTGVFDNLFDKNNTQQSGDGGGDSKPNKPSSDDKNDKDIVSSSIKLPSATQSAQSGSYKATNTPTVTIGTDVKSAAAVLVDLKSNQIIAGKDVDARIYPASMTKVMTLLVACEKATEGGRLLTVEQDMINYAQSLGASGNLGFAAGDKISVEDALYLINYRSDTISCLMIAKYVAGSEAAFVKLMNEKASALGLTGTHFVNTTGLHDENHYTTCRDMAAIMNCAMNNPEAKKILTSYLGRAISIYDANYIKYRNPMVYSGWYSDRLGDAPEISGTDIKVIGGKTGYEDIPTATFVTVAKDASSQKQYVCVVAGRTNTSQSSVSASQSTADTKIIYKSYT